MGVDVEALLHRVIDATFSSDVHVTYSTNGADVHSARLEDSTGTRHAGLEASYWWFGATVFDLAVSTTLFDEDDEEEPKQAALQALALVIQAYLAREGQVENKRGLLRSRPILHVLVDGHEWELGHRTSKPRYPA
jgi:hypothetical protein